MRQHCVFSQCQKWRWKVAPGHPHLRVADQNLIIEYRAVHLTRLVPVHAADILIQVVFFFYFPLLLL